MNRFSKPYADFVQRLRVPMGFLLAGLFVYLATPTLRSVFWGLPIASFGLWLRGWAAGHLEKNERLTMTGPYAWTRNPLYLGTLILVLGMAVAAKRPLFAWISFLAFYFVYLPAVEQEESHLRQLFPEFAAYAQRVNQFRPMFPSDDAPRKKFSWALYWRNREYKAAVAFLGMLVYLFWRAG